MISLKHEGRSNDRFLGAGLGPGTGDADAEKRLKERLCKRLGEQSALRGTTASPTWPWYRYLEEHRDWRPLLARLHKESQAPGELADYFTCQFVEVAKLAIPIIDETLADRR